MLNRLMRFFFMFIFLSASPQLFWAPQGTAQERKPPEAPLPEKKPQEEIKIPRKPLPPNAMITMDFQDVDLNVFIKFIGEVTGKNFLVSEQVRGKVTIISPKKIPVREAYQIFESVLEMNGFTAVQSDGVIKIIPSAVARQSGIQTREGRDPKAVKSEDKMITQVIPLEHAAGEEVRNIFTPMISKDGSIVFYRPTNHLIVTDRAANVHRLLQIIAQLDVPVVEEKISVLTLEFASARSLAEKLTALVAGEQRPPVPGAPPRQAPISRLVRVIPDERTNSLVVLANSQDTQEIRRLVAQLDREAPRGKSQLHVRYLEHARAEDLAKVLSGIIGAKVKTAQKPPGQAAGAPAQPPVEEASIMADKATNSLVITASPQEYRDLEDVILKLDTVRSQVLVEALIAEVSMDKVLQIGVDWRLMDQPVEGSVRGFGGTDFGLISGVQRGTLPSSAGDTGLLLGLAKGFISVGGVQVPNIGALIRAFQSDNDVNVLSTPHLLTMDNEKAKIIVADNVPILRTDLTTPLAAATAGTSNIAVSRTFDYKDIGIQLEITPHISTGTMVRLEIATEVSNLTSTIDPTNPGFVTTRKRQANTTVVVDNGQMVVIGGLIRDDRSETTRKVPCVGNLPGLGLLFKNYAGTRSKTNLLVFITPHIIRSPQDAEKATIRKKQESEEGLDKMRREREKEVKDTLEKLVK